ncbi:MAG: hypothetical protein K9J17_17015 [Flavobacteriales bacterium]|nr:hypothetical protein [Flavobacteriales bacterium]
MIKNLFLVLIAIATVLTAPSCQKKRGCTDNYSDNFDPDAKQDDDTCIPTRDKFLGQYEAYGTIETGQDTLVPYEQVAVNIEDSTATTNVGLIIGISNFDSQLYALRATVVGTYNFSVDRQQLGDFTYWGDGNINGRVMEMKMTRLEKITLPDETFYNDTLYLNLYAIQQIVE